MHYKEYLFMMPEKPERRRKIKDEGIQEGIRRIFGEKTPGAK